MKMIKQITVLCSIFFVLLFSCSDSLNFDQVDDLRAEPEIEASLIYIEAPERTINLGTATFFSQDFNFDAFSSDFFAERVLEGTVTYVVENTTSKELVVSVEFLDDAGVVLDTEVFMVNPAPPADILEREIPYGGTGRSIDIIKNTSSIRVNAENLGNSTSTSGIPDAKVTLKSKGKFKLSII